MINRWLHPPRIHEAARGDARRVGWLELFFDLVFVAALVQLGNALGSHLDFDGVLAFAGVFTPMWLAWTDLTFYNNRYVADDFVHRVLVFAQVFAVGAMAVAVGRVLDGEIAPFVATMAVMKLFFTAMVVRTWYQVPEVRSCGGPDTLHHVSVAGLWLLAAFLPAPWNALVAAAAVLVRVFGKLFGTRLDELSARHPPDVLHMSDRYGLLTLFVLAESCLRVLTGVNEVGPSWTIGLVAALVLGIAFALWWIYFDDVAGARVRRTRLAAYTWVWAHLPLTMAITGVGVGAKQVVFLEATEAAPAGARLLLGGSLVLALSSVAAIDLVTERQHSDLPDRARVGLRVGSAVVVLVVALVGSGMSAVVFCAVLAGVCVAQVLADLAIAPNFDPQAVSQEPWTLWDARRDPEPEAAPEGPPRRNISLAAVGQAVRKGVPNEFRHDAYYFLMDGGWLRMLGALGTVWVGSNVFFGALYLLEPGSVSEVSAEDFLGAFSFSVQTMSGIGYGVMAPQTDYAHALVAVEALVGLLGIALATGLVFAKASRPSVSVLFSEVALIHQRDGKPTLEFRVGNARGAEVVEATIHVSALLAETSPEGHTMRRLHDLELHRKMTPMFALTWTVMHTLDEDSPIRCLREDHEDQRVVAIVCTLTGHDATYGQTTHKRHLYRVDDLRFDQDFVDVVETRPDGRIQVDFARFHDTQPAKV